MNKPLRPLALFACLLALLCIPLHPADTTPAMKGFFASAFSAEYGDDGRTRMIRWEEPLFIALAGDPTEEDIACLNALISRLSKVPGLPPLSLASFGEAANVTLHFVAYGDMKAAVPGYVEGNWGFFHYRRKGYTIYEGTVAIARDVTTQLQRNHLIREEMINLLGLCNDVDFLPQSAIYTGYPKADSLNEIDCEMLALLYHPCLAPGMTMEQARRALE